ncbi:MAG: AAA family ATPase [Sporichthyaceae bacterium]
MATSIHEDLDPLSIEELGEIVGRIRAAMDSVVVGKPEAVRLALVTLLAQGHLLVEDIPGVGKTLLSKTLAKTIDCSVRRVQFTPDLLPSDITGVSIWNMDRREFEFQPGAVFANVVLGDEINRASPKTQSALLEAMEESQVTVDGTTYELPGPFIVVATQNPVEMEGTYALPEAQRDRFMVRLSMGYPDPATEIAMVRGHGKVSPLDSLRPVTDAITIMRCIETIRELHVSDEVVQYVVDIVTATRNHPDLQLGASPRATLQIIRAARASAAIAGRNYVLPDDVQELAEPVLAHRLMLTSESQVAHRGAAAVVADVLRKVPLPEMR